MNIQDQIKVMQHFADGGKVEVKKSEQDGWTQAPQPCWNWATGIYRIADAKIAEGHNPDKLTEDQVGVNDGWRLLSEEEFQHQYSNHGPLGKHARVFVRDMAYWGDGDVSFGYPQYTYRTKEAPGFFLPKPKKRVPLTEEDIPAVCWLRWPTNTLRHMLVVEIDHLFCTTANGQSYQYRDLAEGNDAAEFSPDRKTWLPCYKEVEA